MITRDAPLLNNSTDNILNRCCGLPKLKGVTKQKQAKYERCVRDVKKKNKGKKKKVNPYSVCYNSVIKKKKKPKKTEEVEFDYIIADDIDMPDGYDFEAELQ